MNLDGNGRALLWSPETPWTRHSPSTAAMGGDSVRAVEVLEEGVTEDTTCLREQQDRDYEACLVEDQKKERKKAKEARRKEEDANETGLGWTNCESAVCAFTIFKPTRYPVRSETDELQVIFRSFYIVVVDA